MILVGTVKPALVITSVCYFKAITCIM